MMEGDLHLHISPRGHVNGRVNGHVTCVFSYRDDYDGYLCNMKYNTGDQHTKPNYSEIQSIANRIFEYKSVWRSAFC